MKKSTKATTSVKVRDCYEQNVWDEVVRSLISQGRLASYATAEADRVIAARRRQGAER